MPRPVAASNTRTCCPIAAASTSRSADSLIGIPLGWVTAGSSIRRCEPEMIALRHPAAMRVVRFP
jgi:hypothetical protein